MKFDGSNGNSSNGDGPSDDDLKPWEKKNEIDRIRGSRIPRIVESRCHVCMSKNRSAIDKLIAHGQSYSEIERLFEAQGIQRRSIANHAKKHLGYEEAAIRHIIEHEARQAQEDSEEGVQGVLSRRVYLNVGLKKAYDALINRETIVEPKDAINIIMLLEKLDQETQSAQIDEMKVQFHAFMQAVKDIVPQENWLRIQDRTKELLKVAERYGDQEIQQLPS